MLKQRIITALIMVAVAGTLLFTLSPAGFLLVLIPAFAIAAREWANLAGVESRAGQLTMVGATVVAIAGAAFALGMCGEAFHFEQAFELILIAGVLWALFFLWIQSYPASGLLWGRKPVLVVLGVIVLCLAWVSMAYVLYQPHGRWLFVLLVVCVALTDVGGYFFGKAFGKHKLAPVVSPGKTWEGLAGGLVMQLIPLGGLLYFSGSAQPLWKYPVLLCVVALVSVIGDLFESMIKRHRGIKDSGQLLPGHGGVLDRIDGYLSAAPVYCLLLVSLNLF